MEQELQIPSCLFGGPPVRDDLIKLGESQIGFMNIFARPLFEAVADILPGMQFAVDEILTNKAIWERSNEEVRTKKKRKNPGFSLGLPTPTFAADPTPSPFSGPPLKAPADVYAPTQPPIAQPVQSPPKLANPEDAARRGSSGSLNAVVSASRRSSAGFDKSSRRSSGTGLPGARSLENQSQSRRGSGDASLTAILVTQSPNSSDRPSKEAPTTQPAAPTERKDTLTKSSPKTAFGPSSDEVEKESARPVTAPSSARRSQSKLDSA
jgi:3',5'-cyclic-nucleotide phosphodiesterase